MGEPYGIAVDALRPIVVPVPFPGELERPMRAEDVFSAAAVDPGGARSGTHPRTGIVD
jgi:hypothetical protein